MAEEVINVVSVEEVGETSSAVQTYERLLSKYKGMPVSDLADFYAFHIDRCRIPKDSLLVLEVSPTDQGALSYEFYPIRLDNGCFNVTEYKEQNEIKGEIFFPGDFRSKLH